MRKESLIRPGIAALGIILCLWGIRTAWTAGLSKLNSKYALVSRSLAAADKAVRLGDSDPEAHSSRALVLRNQRALAGAVAEFERAAMLRPRHYVLWYELALARDSVGDVDGALAASTESVRLAPYYGRTHWLLGNLLYRAGRMDEAFAELRLAASSDPQFLPNLVDLAWETYKGDARAVEDIVKPQSNSSRIALSQFFARKGKFREAIAQLRQAGGGSADERRRVLTTLLAAHRYREAYEVWSLTDRENNVESTVGINNITDPSFEGVIQPNEPGFGWQQPAPLENVRTSVDTNNPRQGNRSLSIEFSGNSNPGSPILSQIVLVEGDTHYDLHFAARTEKIVTGGLPQLSIAEARSAGDAQLLKAVTLQPEASTWSDYSLSFTTGKEAQAIIISLQRLGCGVSPCPAFGRVWLDDFTLLKQP